jgi:hypothetical protein
MTNTYISVFSVNSVAKKAKFLGGGIMWRMVIVLVIVGLCVHTAAALPGSGTQQDPWRIESLADFDEFAADPNYWAGFTRLETDVNLAGRTYSAAVIAPDVNNSTWWFDGSPFTGVFDGNDHTITNLTIDGGTNDNLGLFGCIEDGEVRNLGLEGRSLSGRYCVGGLVGSNFGTVSNCHSTGDVNGFSVVGGLVGYNSGTVSDSYSTGSVSGTGDDVGGLGGVNKGSISDCYSSGSVSGTEDIVGGLVGRSDWIISNCYSTGDVTGHGLVGGLVGHQRRDVPDPQFPAQIIDSYSTGDVNGVYGVGGLVGGNYECISNCYSTGDVNGIECVGGLVGHNGYFTLGMGRAPGYIFNSYSTGDVNGVDDVGGLVGYNEAGDIDRSFWDVETANEPNMCGGQFAWATGCDPNCGKTTAEMKTQSTFTEAGWDFIEIWGIGENQTYPFLRTEPAGDFNFDRKVDLIDLAIFADHWLEGKDN